jgi:hypothetical protein
MANVKLIFGGSPDYECFERVLEVYVNQNGGLFIQITDMESEYINSQFTVMDKATAVKFSRELRKQISLMEEEI